MQNTKHRKVLRLPGYNYAQNGAYFITIVTQERKWLFGEVINVEMNLNPLGLIAREEWLRTSLIRPNVEIFEDEFIIMPNHIHGIIWITGRDTARRVPTTPGAMITAAPVERFGKPVPGSIPTIVRAYKSAVTKRINQVCQTPSAPIWQRNYYEHIIRDENDYRAIYGYILANPANWEMDEER